MPTEEDPPDITVWVDAILRGGTLLETRLTALLARTFPDTAHSHAVLDPKLGLYTESFFLRLAETELRDNSEAGLVVFHSDRLEEVRRTRDAALADQVLLQLSSLLKSRLMPQEWLSRLGPDSLALFLPRLGLREAQRRAQNLHAAIREGLRLPVSVGLAHSKGLAGGAQELSRLAREAAQEAWQSGKMVVRTKTASGLVPPPAAAGEDAVALFPAGASLAARYQKLVLLNRISLELFGNKPFALALADASRTMLALMAAKYVAIYFCDDLGMPHVAHRYGDKAFLQPDSAAEERALVRRVFSQRQTIVPSGARLGWMAVPLLPTPQEDPAQDGALVVGFAEPGHEEPEAAQTMLEISRLLRNARLTQRNLQQQRIMAAVTEQSPDAILLTDLSHRIISWNSGCQELFQYKKQEVLGKTVDFLVPKDKMAELKSLEEQALTQGGPRNHSIETVRQRKDGSLVPVEGTFTTLIDDKSQAFGMVRVFRDITRRKEIERMKTEFVSLVSHELRTPLTSIQGFAETLCDAWDELPAEKRRNYLGIILAESNRLGLLVTDFLDISKLEEGGVPLRPKEVDLPSLAARVAALFRDHPSKAVFEARFQAGGEKVWADEDQIYRVFVNLCGNALKYTPPGGAITISGRPDGKHVEVSVEDRGPGISREDQEKIFRKFFRAGDPISLKTPGTGLGLAICKGIIESHGGRIWVESEPGQGTRFKFSLPMEGPK
jgi:PAS domain S-box-containing protein